ncbi:MAG: hypothetical protein JWQ96_65 [Segetibacter sp.]|nr:hypothetical protein [Segetibacter sp.]
MNITFEFEGQKQLALLIVRGMMEGRQYHVFLKDRKLIDRFQLSYLFINSGISGLQNAVEKNGEELSLINSITGVIEKLIEKEQLPTYFKKRKTEINRICGKLFDTKDKFPLTLF